MTDTPVTELLIKARANIAKGWTKGVYGRRADGTAATKPSEACSFCASGAVDAANNSRDHFGFGSPLGDDNGHYTQRGTAMQLLSNAASKLTGSYMNIVAYNDDVAQSQEDMLAVFDLAIEESRNASAY